MRAIPFAIPSLLEQAAIVRFLDYADRRIRRSIRAKQKLSKLLEEQKQAIIHRAATRGLDPNVRLKSSGAEWMGDVSEHWEVKRLRYLIEGKLTFFSPEQPLLDELTTPENKTAVEEYKAQAARQSDIQRGAVGKDKTGVFTGSYAINPVNNARNPIWIADYVMMSYGTGAIMAVPAHDERDFAFAKKYEMPIVPVIKPEGQSEAVVGDVAYIGPGTMVNSGLLSGTPGDQAFGRTVSFLDEQNIGRRAVNYLLRDWLISRQRYWPARSADRAAA